MTQRMDPTIKQQWVAALKSGEYTKGTGALRRQGTDGKEYCCLGVLCDLYMRQHDEGNWSSGGNIPDSFLGAVAALPVEVSIWAGLPNGYGTLDEPFTYTDPDSGITYTRDELTTINDDTQMTFPEIADLIESRF